jgi:YlmC/YmxH family sporulation protein
MTFRELCAKEVVQLSNGACLGKADDLELDPQTAQIQSLQLLGRPRFFGLLGRDATLTIPWEEIDKIGVDAVLVRTELPPPEPKNASFWQTLRHWLDG